MLIRECANVLIGSLGGYTSMQGINCLDKWSMKIIYSGHIQIFGKNQSFWWRDD